jgi:hypothetical protein
LLDDIELAEQTCPQCGRLIHRPIIRHAQPPPTERQERLLREEFPTMHDAELGIEPMFGYDNDGLPIY